MASWRTRWRRRAVRGLPTPSGSGGAPSPDDPAARAARGANLARAARGRGGRLEGHGVGLLRAAKHGSGGGVEVLRVVRHAYILPPCPHPVKAAGARCFGGQQGSELRALLINPLTSSSWRSRARRTDAIVEASQSFPQVPITSMIDSIRSFPGRPGMSVRDASTVEAEMWIMLFVMPLLYHLPHTKSRRGGLETYGAFEAGSGTGDS